MRSLAQRHGLEAEPAQRVGDQLGVARRIVERMHVLVGAVADHERDAARRARPPGPCGVSAASRSCAIVRAIAVSMSSNGVSAKPAER